MYAPTSLESRSSVLLVKSATHSGMNGVLLMPNSVLINGAWFCILVSMCSFPFKAACYGQVERLLRSLPAHFSNNRE